MAYTLKTFKTLTDYKAYILELYEAAYEDPHHDLRYFAGDMESFMEWFGFDYTEEWTEENDGGEYKDEFFEFGWGCDFPALFSLYAESSMDMSGKVGFCFPCLASLESLGVQLK